MNILFLTKENNGGGLVTHVINLANIIEKRGNTSIVIGPLVNGNKERFKDLNCKYIPLSLGTKNLFKFIRNTQILKKVVVEEKIDIIHSHNRVASVYAQIINMQTGIPFVWTLHLNNIPSNPISRMLTFYGEKVIVVSSDIIYFCVKKLKIKRNDIVVGYNGVYEKEYISFSEDKKKIIREKYGIKKNQKVIVLLCRLDPIKQHKIVIEALNGIKSDKEFVVLFTGESMVPGYKEELKRLVTKNGLDDYIKFVGYVNPVEILNISDLFVLPSGNEGFPISMIEAFLLHVPVVRTRTGGYKDVKKSIIAMDGVDDLREVLKRFLNDELETEDIVERGYKFAIKNCTCDAMAEKVLSVYEEILKVK